MKHLKIPQTEITQEATYTWGEMCLFMTDGEQQKQTEPEHNETNTQLMKH